MTTENQIEKKLRHQVDLLFEINKSLQYLILFPEFLKKTGNDKPKDLWFIYHVLRNNTILNLHKLYNPKEDYSFDKIKQLVFKICDKTDDKIKDYTTLLKSGKKLFEKLDIKSIRDTHVGHLDANREAKSIDWNEVKKLTQISCDIHDKINIYFFRTQNAWPIDNNLLNSLFINDLRSLELFNLKRQLFSENLISTSRDEILRLTKINWP